MHCYGTIESLFFLKKKQILIVTSGNGFYQQKDKRVQALCPGDTVNILRGIINYHGADPTGGFIHIAINTNIPNSVIKWLEPLSNDEYNHL